MLVFSVVGLFGSDGVLCDCGQRRSRDAGRLNNLDVLTDQTCHKLLARGAACKEELMGHSGQYGAHHRAKPINLHVGKTEKIHYNRISTETGGKFHFYLEDE